MVLDDDYHWNRLSEEVWNWLIEHFGDHNDDIPEEEHIWSWDYRGKKEVTFLFKNKDDAMFFKLTWC
jgi:hypothetical protein